MARYARETEVPVERTKVDIEKTLTRYGATAFMYGATQERAVVQFELEQRRIRISLTLPQSSDHSVAYSPAGKYRTATQRQAALEQERRSLWRSLLLVIKAKLEAVDAGISTIEQEFLAFVVLPNGQTVDEWVGPQIQRALDENSMPPLLPAAYVEVENREER